ncbi:MAG: GNAT family N-acetyltransferase [Candidatus Hodarchaeota archaeon]
MLEGKNVNLRIREKEDLPLIAEWTNNPEFWGEFFSPLQRSRFEMEKAQENNPFESQMFLIEKKDGTPIGFTMHFCMLHPMGKFLEMGFVLIPSERRKGYCTEAAKIMVDYLFLSKDIVCIQGITDVGNIASQKVLEKAGFKKEGLIRKRFFARGEWKDTSFYSILRDEWKEPKILKIK